MPRGWSASATGRSPAASWRCTSARCRRRDRRSPRPGRDVSTIDEVSLLAGPGVRGYLDRLEAMLQRTVADRGGPAAEAAGRTLTAGGKRLRPLLCYLS